MTPGLTFNLLAVVAYTNLERQKISVPLSGFPFLFYKHGCIYVEICFDKANSQVRTVMATLNEATRSVLTVVGGDVFYPNKMLNQRVSFLQVQLPLRTTLTWMQT